MVIIFFFNIVVVEFDDWNKKTTTNMVTMNLSLSRPSMMMCLLYRGPRLSRIVSRPLDYCYVRYYNSAHSQKNIHMWVSRFVLPNLLSWLLFLIVYPILYYYMGDFIRIACSRVYLQFQAGYIYIVKGPWSGRSPHNGIHDSAVAVYVYIFLYSLYICIYVVLFFFCCCFCLKFCFIKKINFIIILHAIEFSHYYYYYYYYIK